MCTVTTFVLIPGAGGAAWYWSRVIPLLHRAGREAIAIDLPADDESAGLPEYASLVHRAIDAAFSVNDTAGGPPDVRDDLVIVGQSLGGFTAARVAAERPVRAVVFVNAMIPAPGESAGAWWANVGQEQASREAAERGGYSAEFDEEAWFLHDVDPLVAAEGEPYQRPEAGTAFEATWDVDAWPDVPVHVVAGRDDRLFPVALQQRMARERLGVEAAVLPGGHLMALSQPTELANHLLSL